MKHFTAQSTIDMDKETWLASRNMRIGGSDASVVLGINNWKTPYILWLEKTGQLAPADLSENESVIFGNLLEDFIAKQFAERIGLSVRKDNSIKYSTKYPFMCANVDRLLTAPNISTRGILEVKTTNGFTYKSDWFRDGEECVPQYYTAQLQHYFAVTGYTWGYFAVLVDGRKLKFFQCDRDETYIEQVLIPAEVNFNKHMVEMTPPEPMVSDLNYISPNEGSNIKANEKSLGLIGAIKKERAEIKLRTETLDRYEDNLKLILSDYESITDESGNILATYKSQTSNRFDSKTFKKDYKELAEKYTNASSSRVLRIK